MNVVSHAWERARAQGPTAAEQPPPTRRMHEQFAWYVVAGTVTTAAHAGLFLLFRGLIGPFPANLLAIVITATANTEFHRWHTFRGKGSTLGRRAVATGLTILYDATYSTAALLGLQLFVSDPTATQQTATIVAAAALGGLARFLLLRYWVFIRHPR